MKVQISKFERVAGLFVLLAMGLFAASTVAMAVKQGWFSRKIQFHTTFSRGEGLHAGTLVQMTGLRAGTVDSVELDDQNRISVVLSVSQEFAKRIRKDSMARVIRPFIIGDKVVEITVGSEAVLAENSALGSEETMDIMDLMGGGHLGPYLDTLNGLVKSLKIVADAFSDTKRTSQIVALFDEALPTVRDLHELTRQAIYKKNLKNVLGNVNILTGELNQNLPMLVEFSKQLPELGGQGKEIMVQLSQLTTSLNEILPQIAAVAPKIPEMTEKSVAALKEAVIVLRAMQKSFLLRGGVKEVMEEDAARMPASEEKKDKK